MEIKPFFIPPFVPVKQLFVESTNEALVLNIKFIFFVLASQNSEGVDDDALDDVHHDDHHHDVKHVVV